MVVPSVLLKLVWWGGGPLGHYLNLLKGGINPPPPLENDSYIFLK